MTAIQNQLRRIDQEITLLRQQIARCRNEIGALEEARLVVIGLAERDQMGARPEEPPLLNGSQGPLLVVRKALSDGEEGPAPRVHSKKGKKMPRKEETAAFHKDIMELFKEHPVLEAGEVIRAMHAHGATNKQKGRVYNALVRLKANGQLQQTQIGEPYTLPVNSAAPH